jgi:hypothetical protein
MVNTRTGSLRVTTMTLCHRIGLIVHVVHPTVLGDAWHGVWQCVVSFTTHQFCEHNVCLILYLYVCRGLLHQGLSDTSIQVVKVLKVAWQLAMTHLRSVCSQVVRVNQLWGVKTLPRVSSAKELSSANPCGMCVTCGPGV